MNNAARKKLKQRFPVLPASVTRHMCADKVVFDTERQASIFAIRAVLKFGTKQEPYCCKLCSKYHLATKKDR